MKWNVAHLETIKCDYCLCEDNRLIFVRPDGLSVVECAKCGLAFINPRPKPEEIYKLYNKDYFTDERDGLYLKGISKEKIVKEDMEYYLNQIANMRLNVLKKYYSIKDKRVLEIGSGQGYFSFNAKTNGADIIGIDINQDAIDESKKRFPFVDFRLTSGDRIDFEDNSFDCICCFEVIEHVLSPKKFFIEINRILKKEGFAIFSTPNIDCARNIGYDKWVGFYRSWEHIYYFNTESIVKYLSDNNLTLIDSLTYGNGYVDLANTMKTKSKSFTLNILKFLKIFKSVRYLRDRFLNNSRLYKNNTLGNNLIFIFRK